MKMDERCSKQKRCNCAAVYRFATVIFHAHRERDVEITFHLNVRGGSKCNKNAQKEKLATLRISRSHSVMHKYFRGRKHSVTQTAFIAVISYISLAVCAAISFRITAAVFRYYILHHSKRHSAYGIRIFCFKRMKRVRLSFLSFPAIYSGSHRTAIASPSFYLRVLYLCTVHRRQGLNKKVVGYLHAKSMQ